MFDWNTTKDRLNELNLRTEDPELWSDPVTAHLVMRERQILEKRVKSYYNLEQQLEDAITLIELGEAEADNASVQEGQLILRKLSDLANKQQIDALLSGEADSNDTFVEIHAGAGGTESQDW
ncbi:MAG: PCRF domain-containing protein, partial [Hyphomicrobiaceae bacterium]|nr:PCRF domain-containing protein [Hyphomicrobiaceae bacterium]